jgi:hypothetical protein
VLLDPADEGSLMAIPFKITEVLRPMMEKACAEVFAKHSAEWKRIFDSPRDYEEEPVLFGFGEPRVKEIDMLQVPPDFWSKLPVPVDISGLEYAINDWKHARMFYAMSGPPRAYFEMPTGFIGASGHEVVHRVIYTVMGFRKRLDPGETIAQAEPKLCAALWNQLIDVRRELQETHGDHDFVLFWRRGPELTDDSQPGSPATCAKVSIRIAIPGADLQALMGGARDGIDLPWLLTPDQAREERHQREIAEARRKVEQAVQTYINRLSRYSTGSHVSQAQQYATAALRQLLDSAAMAQFAPRDVRLETRTQWVLAESRGLPNPVLERLGDLNSAAKSLGGMVEAECTGANVLNSSFSNRLGEGAVLTAQGLEQVAAQCQQQGVLQLVDGVSLISAAHPDGLAVHDMSRDEVAGQCQQQGLWSKPPETLG